MNGLPSKKDLPSSDETLKKVDDILRDALYERGHNGRDDDAAKGVVEMRRWTMKESTYNSTRSKKTARRKGSSRGGL